MVGESKVFQVRPKVLQHKLGVVVLDFAFSVNGVPLLQFQNGRGRGGVEEVHGLEGLVNQVGREIENSA